MTVLRTGAAVVVVMLFGAALALMARGQLSLAGLSFIGASVLIYLRETQL